MKGAILFERIPGSGIIQFSAGCGGLFFATQLVLLLKLAEVYTPQAYKIENQHNYLFDNNILHFVTYKEQEVKKTNSLLLKTFSS